MSNAIEATSSYGDMRGTMSLDGWDRLVAMDVGVGWKKGYYPVGVEVLATSQARGGKLRTAVYLLLAKEETLGGSGPDVVAEFAKTNGRLPVIRYAVEVDTAKLLGLIKRMGIVL